MRTSLFTTKGPYKALNQPPVPMQTIAAMSCRGVVHKVIKLGYADVIEFQEYRLIVTNADYITYIDSMGNSTLISKGSHFYQTALSRMDDATLLFESVLNQ